MTVVTDITSTVKALRAYSLPGGEAVREFPEVSHVLSLPDGTATSTADDVYVFTETITATAHTNLDLFALSQEDSAGTTLRAIIMANVKAILIKNTNTAGGAGYIQIGGGTDGAGAADAWAGVTTPFETDASTSIVPPGGHWQWYSPTGGTVTNSTANILHLGALSANQTYEIIIIGDHT
jgi:hypothetical protein